MSFGRNSLLSGAQVRQIVWQPKIRAPLALLGKYTVYRMRSLLHLVILTDRELIVIEDHERSNESRGVRYGGKWRYVALEHIGAAALSAPVDGCRTLALTLIPGGPRIEIPFAAGTVGAAARLRDSLAERGAA